MSQTVNSEMNNSEAPPAFTSELLYAPVARELTEMESLLRRELRSRFPSVDELVRYGCLLGGKRLRPALLLLTGQACGALGEPHIVLATVMEMIHTATLVHDDVLDRAELRRHLATVNSRWDDEASVLLGDYLFSHAFYLASTLDTAIACQWIGRSTNVVCEGELRQKAGRGDFQMTEAAYLSIIDAKTAELCACSCRLGAHFAGASAETVDSLAHFGRELGVAFQIADDLLDFQGDEQETGKSLGTDFEQRIPTLPLIHTLQQADAAERGELLKLLRSENATPEALAPYIRQYRGIEYAVQRAREFADSASQRLDKLTPSLAVETLRQVAKFVVKRTF